MAKYLARTGESRPVAMLKDRLELSDRTLPRAIATLEKLGYTIQQVDDQISLTAPTIPLSATQYGQIAHDFLTAVQEECFRQQYFYEVPVDILEQVLGTMPAAASVVTPE